MSERHDGVSGTKGYVVRGKSQDGEIGVYVFRYHRMAPLFSAVCSREEAAQHSNVGTIDFVELAKHDDALRGRIDQTIAEYFRGNAASPTDEAARPVVLGLLDLAAPLALTGSAPALRDWLCRNEELLRADADALLGRAVLAALVTTLPRGTADSRDFWLRLYRTAPVAWQSRAFMGLRRCDPAAV